MNILEHYIVKVHATKELNGCLVVDVTCNCWGDVRRIEHTTTKEQWHKDLARGYFMA